MLDQFDLDCDLASARWERHFAARSVIPTAPNLGESDGDAAGERDESSDDDRLDDDDRA